jgi:hypothetical protein
VSAVPYRSDADSATTSARIPCPISWSTTDRATDTALVSDPFTPTRTTTGLEPRVTSNTPAGSTGRSVSLAAELVVVVAGASDGPVGSVVVVVVVVVASDDDDIGTGVVDRVSPAAVSSESTCDRSHFGRGTGK